MKLQEIYVINDALDGEDIFGLPSFGSVKMSKLRVRQIREGLVDKGICDDISCLSKNGERMVKTILRYKEVAKYVQIDAVTFAIIDNVAAIMQQYDPQEEEYDFTLVNLANIPFLIGEAYPFLRETGISKTSDEKRTLSGKEFEQLFLLNHTNSFCVNIWENGVETSNDVYFSSDDMLYIYDRSSLLLVNKSSDEMFTIVQNDLSIGNPPLSANAV